MGLFVKEERRDTANTCLQRWPVCFVQRHVKIAAIVNRTPSRPIVVDVMVSLTSRPDPIRFQLPLLARH